MRRLLTWSLIQFAGSRLASDILGDLEERGGGTLQLALLTLSVASYRIRSGLANTWTDRPRLLGMSNDLRYGVRSLFRAPWYATAVISVIAVTAALATTAFAVVDGVLFRRLPIPAPETLFATTGPNGAALSLADLAAWKQAAPGTRMSLYGPDFVLGATSASRPQHLVAMAVDTEFFDVLGVRPVIGAWRQEDFQPGAPTTRLMISDRLWHRLFAGRTDVVGRPLELAGAADHMRRPLGLFEVAGVLPYDFVFPLSRATPDLLLPMVIPSDRVTSRNDSAGRVLIRTTQPTPALSAALTQAFGTAPSTMATFEAGGPSPTVVFTPIGQLLTLRQRADFRTSFELATVLMLLAIINVAGISVLRGQQRRRELGVRRALGATRAALFRLAACEATPLVGAGMLVALALSPAMLASTLARMPEGIVLIKPPMVDQRLIVFWFGLSLVIVIATAAVQTMAISDATVSHTPGQQGTVSGRSRAGKIIVAVQVALAFAITTVGALIAGSFWRLQQEPIGFPLAQRSLIELSQQSKSGDIRRALGLSLVDRVKAVQGVEAVAPLDDGEFLTAGERSIPFATAGSIARATRPGAFGVTPAFFELLKINPIAGRLLTDDEVRARAPVFVLSQSVAERFFPNGDAVGGVVKVASTEYRVVGVVPDVQTHGLGWAHSGQAYQPASLSGQRMSLLVLGSIPIERLVAAVTEKGIGITRAQTLSEAVELNRTPGFRTWLFGWFTAATLLIVAIGTFGTVAMSVAGRTRELGVRSALGATRRSIIGLFVREQIVIIASGLAIGAVLATWSARLVKPMLFKTTPDDPRLWLLAAMTLVGVAAVAAFIPSFAGSQVDPVRALRED